MKYLKIFEKQDSVYDILYTLVDIFTELSDEGFYCTPGTNDGVISMYISKGYDGGSLSFKRREFIYDDFTRTCIKRAVNYMSAQGYEYLLTREYKNGWNEFEEKIFINSSDLDRCVSLRLSFSRK